MKKLFAFSVLFVLQGGVVFAAEGMPTSVEAHKKIVLPQVKPADRKPAVSVATEPADVYPIPPTSMTGRRVYSNLRSTNRGSTVPVPVKDVAELCSGRDGCTVRIGMHNWDNTGRVLSREFVLYYNKVNKNWATSGDSQGTKSNSATEHLYQAWACYFTDGTFSNWVDKGDSDPDNFGLLSWTQNNADCFLTIVR